MENNNGEFRWGVVNWTLIDPASLLRSEDDALKAVREHNDYIKSRMGG